LPSFSSWISKGFLSKLLGEHR